MSDTHIVAVLRASSGLTALVSRPRKMTGLPSLQGEGAMPAWRMRFETVELPLASVPQRLCPARNRILVSWEALRAGRWDARARFHALRLAIETVPHSESPMVVPSEPDGEIQPRRHRPTAAHPRAWRGTHDRPPKPRRAPSTDLRPFVSNPRGLAEVLRMTREVSGEALAQLARDGYDEGRLALAASCRDESDFGLAYHHDGPRPRGITLPPAFAVQILPLLRGLPWGAMRAALSVHRGLRLEDDPDLRASVVRLFASTPASFALDWCRIAALRPEARQPVFLALVAESNTRLSAPPPDMEGLLARLDACTPDDQFPCRMRALLGGLEKGATPDYLLEGIEMASRYAVEYSFDEVPSGTDFPTGEMPGLLRHIASDVELWWPDFALTLWKRCGDLPGIPDMIRRTQWLTLSPGTAFLLLRLLNDVVHHDVEAAKPAKWRFLRREFPRVVERVRETPPDYQEKFVEALRRFYWVWDRVEDLERHWPTACAISARLSHPPFDEEDLASGVLHWFIDALPTEESARVLGAPDRCFRALERSADGALHGDWRTDQGVGALADQHPSLLRDAFLRFPTALFGTARVLGSLPTPERHRVLDAYGSHPIAQTGIFDRPVSEVVALLRRHAPPGANPVPRRLRELVERGRLLKAGQIERHLRILGERLGRVQLAAIEELAVEAMGRGIPLDRRDEALRHALQMLRFSDGNRRGLRRLLQAIAQGRSPGEYLLQHPETQAWLRHHPRVIARTWIQGITRSVDVLGAGKLTLALEHDPLEALRLGTYVGTCLGLGQVCAYSAAAVVLDVNKQVVYARNAKGKVVARQILAISEDDRLVCFQVYPHNASSEVQAAFLEYDLQFAEALGLSFDDAEGSARIAHILSREWWDDYAWDIFEAPTNRT